MYKLNSGLIYVLVFSVFLLFFAGFSVAQEVPAEPVISVTEEALQVPAGQDGLVLIELFSTQSCFFCPQADRLFADLIRQKHIVGLSCHIDYFDVNENTLSHSFCTERQKFYMERLKAGLPYTPQIVINGVRDVVGYRLQNVNDALGIAKARPEISIERSGQGVYAASLPALRGGDMDLWLAVFDKPAEITIAEGRNRGKKVNYFNIVSQLEKVGTWDGAAKTQDIAPVFTKQNAGFVLIAQERETGQVRAIGMFEIR